MRSERRYMGVVLCGMMMLLMAACGTSDSEEEVVVPKLQIHIYTPEHPVVTRGNEGPVAAAEAERQVKSLHIWVFRHDNGERVGYLNPTVSPLEASGTYLMEVSDVFAKEKPSVDVYVMANVTADNCGVNLGSDATRQEIQGALVGTGFFGLATPQTTVPDDGLPMSGVLIEQTLGGTAPVLTAGTVTVVRTVSKARFIFTCAKSADKSVSITHITFDAGMIPDEEYLFLSQAYQERAYKTGSTYNTSEVTLAEPGSSFTVPESVDPGKYVFTGGMQSGQDYETLIDNGLTAQDDSEAELGEVGPFYLRESDKRVTGRIHYTVDGENKSVPFEMEAALDFTRNHTWIVYAYFVGNDNLRVLTVTVTPWETITPGSHTLYNW